MNNLIYVKYDTDHFTRISQEGELYALNRDQLELNFAQRLSGIKMRTNP